MKYCLIVVLFFAACNGAADMKTQFDDLEKVFETGNWKIISSNDTSYSFFSREGDTVYKVYTYHLEKGDSVRSNLSTVQPKNGGMIWNGNEFRYKKRDSLHIDLIAGGNHLVMLRTLPISTFLIRSKYDFLHGTNTAGATVDTVRRRH